MASGSLRSDYTLKDAPEYARVIPIMEEDVESPSIAGAIGKHGRQPYPARSGRKNSRGDECTAII